jgi:hypothetical protein
LPTGYGQPGSMAPIQTRFPRRRDRGTPAPSALPQARRRRPKAPALHPLVVVTGHPQVARIEPGPALAKRPAVVGAAALKKIRVRSTYQGSSRLG